MNKEYTYVDGKVITRDEKGSQVLDAGIEVAKEYLEEKGPILTKRKKLNN